MDTLPIWAQLLALFLLICCSAFFSISETALIALNIYRVKHMAQSGSFRARITLWMLERTDQLLSLILIANTLVNALVAALITAIAIASFGNNEKVLTATTCITAFLLIIFAEITPKMVGATYPERIALIASPVLRALMVVAYPFIWITNQFVNALLRILHIQTGIHTRNQRFTPEELRTIVLEGSTFIPQKHKSILVNLFDLEAITVEDVMTPRPQIEALNLAVPIEAIRRQLTTCYHNKLPVYEGEINQIVGILHVRKALSLLDIDEQLTAEHFRELLSTPYFIPIDTDVFTQLQYFQENRERLGVVVDEYGEVQGLVTLEDIIEEMIGEFTTTLPSPTRVDALHWNEQNECLLEGSSSLREINKRLGLALPLKGPKTINGLLLEKLEDIPEAHVSLKLPGCVAEVIQVKNQAIKIVKLVRSPKEK